VRPGRRRAGAGRPRGRGLERGHQRAAGSRGGRGAGHRSAGGGARHRVDRTSCRPLGSCPPAPACALRLGARGPGVCVPGRCPRTLDAAAGGSPRRADGARARHRRLQLHAAVRRGRHRRALAEGDGRVPGAAPELCRPRRSRLSRQPRGRGLVGSRRRPRAGFRRRRRRHRPLPRDHRRQRAGAGPPELLPGRRPAQGTRRRAAPHRRLPLRIHLLGWRREAGHRGGPRAAPARVRGGVLRADRRRLALLPRPDRRGACQDVPSSAAAVVPVPRGGPDGRDVAADAAVRVAVPRRGRDRRLQSAERMDRVVGGEAHGRALRRLSQPAQPPGLPAQRSC